MEGVDFQQLESFFVLGKKVGMLFEEAGGPPDLGKVIAPPGTEGLKRRFQGRKEPYKFKTGGDFSIIGDLP